MSVVASVTIVLALIFALFTGVILGQLIADRIMRFGRAGNILSSSLKERVLIQLQKGFPRIDVVSKWLCRKFKILNDVADRGEYFFFERKMNVSKYALMSALLIIAFAVGLICWIATSSTAFGIASACILFVSVVSAIKNHGEKQDAAMREEVPEAIRSLEMSFRSGHSLPQTLKSSSTECSGYLGRLFAVSLDRLEMGAPPTEALALMCNNTRVPELSFVAVALAIQHQSGGSIGPVLESTMKTVESELKLMRNLRVQTAQAKLSATIVTVMPFILIALFSMMSPDFLKPFFSSVLGVALLAIALTMQVIGVLFVRRALKVDEA